MANEWGSFKHGGAAYPLADPGSNPILYDADPALYGLQAYLKYVIQRYVLARMTTELSNAGLHKFTGNVETYPMSVEPFLGGMQAKFPILAVYRIDEELTQERTVVLQTMSIARFGVEFVLPPCDVAQARLAYPLLVAAARAMQNRIDYAFDPSYTPAGGAAGSNVLKAAGIEQAGFIRGSYGTWKQVDSKGNPMAFPAWMGELQVREIGTRDESQFEQLATIATELEDPDDATLDYVSTLVDPSA